MDYDNNKMTDEEFVGKVDYEGGLLDAVFGYGLSEDDLEDGSRLKPIIARLTALTKEIDSIQSEYWAIENELDIEPA